MVIRFLYALLGCGMGVVAAVVALAPWLESPVPCDQGGAVARCTQALEAERRSAVALEQKLTALATVTAATGDATSSERVGTRADVADVEQRGSEQGAAEALKWKISAIEKFVPLTDDQKDRLRIKYELEASQTSGEASTEQLEDIIGAENATFYRQQVRAAFQRVQDEETEKEVVWLARSLRLSNEQEQAALAAFREVEQQMDQDSHRAGQDVAHSPQDRFKAMIAENKKRSELRAARLKNMLSAEQFESYVKAEAASSSADVEVFHDPQ